MLTYCRLLLVLFSVNSVVNALFRMKPVLLLIVLFLIPSSTLAHPGKTNYKGGHKCWKNCSEWELGRGEYHLHDEDWNPVHIGRQEKVIEKEQPKGVPTPEKRFLLEDNGSSTGPVTEVPETKESSIPEQRAVAAKNRMQTVYEENFLPFNSIFLLLLALLMLIVLIYVLKKREKG